MCLTSCLRVGSGQRAERKRACSSTIVGKARAQAPAAKLRNARAFSRWIRVSTRSQPRRQTDFRFRPCFICPRTLANPVHLCGGCDKCTRDCAGWFSRGFQPPSNGEKPRAVDSRRCKIYRNVYVCVCVCVCTYTGKRGGVQAGWIWAAY